MAALRKQNSTASMGRRSFCLVSVVVVLIVLARSNLVHSRAIQPPATSYTQVDGREKSVELHPFPVPVPSNGNTKLSLDFNKLASGPSKKGPGH
uniref:Uncharacterized protein n=1 Tax=Nelumbo nucifera TaxID=4432 RepID=A0A822XNX9_NELNU|nr:TPA_asm: hypothetical protein HUJ06_022866 [Nelumbo nucifera]